MINIKTILRLLGIILAVLLALTIYNSAYSQEVFGMVEEYGCNALYTTDDPNIIGDYMVELMGHQPVKTTLTSYVSELSCKSLDVGRIIFNVCGIGGDEHRVCQSWKEEYPHFYTDERYFTFYSSAVMASRSRIAQQVITTPQETIEPQSFSGGINMLHIIVIAVILAISGYILYNRSMRQSTPSLEN